MGLGLISLALAGSVQAATPVQLPDAATRSAISTTNRLDRAFELKEQANQGKLGVAGLAEAGVLLADPDLFVQGMAEWAIATQVGIDNNREQTQWPKAQIAGWYRAWSALSQAQRVELDWVRQAVALGFYNDPAKLVASVADYVRRARGLQAAPGLDAERKGIMDRAVTELTRLNQAMTAAGSDPATLRALWLEARRALRPGVLAQAGADFDQIVLSTVFAPHHPPNIVGTHTAWTHKPGGDLCLLSGWRTGATELRPILAGKLGPGHVHGLDLWFDADRLVFAWARQEGWPRPKNCKVPSGKSYHHELRQAHEPTHLYEIALDGSGLRQLTSDPYWTDLEPVWLPDGGVVFTSDRCAHAVICDAFSNDEANLNIYALRPGGDIRRLTNNKDLDRHPCLLNNGLIAYTRWEYQERHFWDIHSLWTVRPDGTMADALFKQHLTRPMGLRDARAIPGSGKLVAIATGHHTYAIGPLVLVDPSVGINNPEGLRNVSPGVVEQEHKHGSPMKAATVPEGGLQDAGGFYQTPCALSEGCFLVGYSYATGRSDHLAPHPEGGVDSNGMGLYLVDVFGNKELLYRDPLLGVMYPMPVKRRPRPTVQPDLVKPSQPWATCVLSDVYHNIGPEVSRGSVKWLRLSEALPWPLDATHGSYKWPWGSAWQPNAGQTSWNPVRVIGLVPVEADGSAHFQVPPVQAGSVYFQALDEHFMEIRRMRSNVSFQPGEVRSCYGCHESQNNVTATGTALAAAKPAVRPVPPSWGADRAIGYEWMIQPILDRHCVSCHGEKEPSSPLKNINPIQDGSAGTPRPTEIREFSQGRAKPPAEPGVFRQAARAKLDLSARKMPTKEREMNQSYLSLMGRNIDGSGHGNGRDSFVWISNRFSDGSVSKAYEFGSTRSKLAQVLRKGHHKVKLDADEWLRLVTWIDANAPYHDRFIDKRPADGGLPSRDAEFRWPAPFATTQEVDWVRVDGSK
jgi:hypothetical protein